MNNHIFQGSLLASIVFSFCFGSLASAEEEFSQLLAKLPSTANAILLIDAEGLRNSPLGRSLNWSDRNEVAYSNSATYLPPEADKIVVATKMNANNAFAQDWELAVMSLQEVITARAIARAEGGVIDAIGGNDAVWSPQGAYFAFFEKDVLGVMAPADRQALSNWVSGSLSVGKLSDFLLESVTTISANQQIVMAIDLKDAAIPHRLKAALSEAELLKNDAQLIESWYSIVQGLLGVTFSVTVGDEINGSLRVEFSADPDGLGKEAKEGIIQVLNQYGLGFEGIEKWDLNKSGHAIILQGEMSLPDLRKVMSLLELPSSNFSQLADAQPATVNDQESVVKASKKYFDSMSTLLEDLENEFRTNKYARRNFAATYMQRYAKRIDDLPILNVDVELVDFGISVSETLRSTSVIQGEASVETGVRKSSVYNSNNAGYYNDYRSASSIKTQIKREEQSVASKARFNNWKEIQDGSAAIRVKMTQKYGVEF